jgi:hypothetical protein
MSAWKRSASGSAPRRCGRAPPGVGAARLEAVVPDVERLERAAEALLDEPRRAGHQRRRQHLSNIARTRASGISRPRRRRGRWRSARSASTGPRAGRRGSWPAASRSGRPPPGRRRRRRQRRVAGDLVVDTRSTGDLVRERVPVDARVVDDGGGDRLRDDPLHHRWMVRCRSSASARGYDALISSRRFQWEMRRMPSGKRRRRRRPRGGASRCCSRRCTRRPRPRRDSCLVHLRRQPAAEALREARLRPLRRDQSAHAASRCSSVVSGKFSSTDEGDLVLEQVGAHVRRRVVRGEQPVERQDLAALDVRVHAQLPDGLEHEPVELLEDQASRRVGEHGVALPSSGRRPHLHPARKVVRTNSARWSLSCAASPSPS